MYVQTDKKTEMFMCGQTDKNIRPCACTDRQRDVNPGIGKYAAYMDKLIEAYRGTCACTDRRIYPQVL